MLFSALWAYHTTIKTSTSFTPFQFVYGLEVVLPIECEILSPKLAIKLLHVTYANKEFFVHLALNENRHNFVLASEVHQKSVKAQYNQNVNPRTYSKGKIVLVYDQAGIWSSSWQDRCREIQAHVAWTLHHKTRTS